MCCCRKARTEIRFIYRLYTHTHTRKHSSLYCTCTCMYASPSLEVLSHSFSSRRPLGTCCSINPLLFMDLGRYFHAPAARSSFSSFYLFFTAQGKINPILYILYMSIITKLKNIYICIISRFVAYNIEILRVPNLTRDTCSYCT